MVLTLNLLQNVGKFENVTAGLQLPFGRLTVIYAENARGKTTLAAILRSWATGRADLITERSRLGAQNPPRIEISVGAADPTVFANGAWTSTAPEIAVFDDGFVAENVCSGIEIAPFHRQNLHELIVGAQGIALANALQREVLKIEEHNRALRQREAAIPPNVRGNLTVDAFCALRMIPDLEALIEEAKRRLAAARDAEKIASTPIFAPLRLPKIDIENFRLLLKQGLKDLDAGALRQVQEHLGRLGREGEEWVAKGMELTKPVEEGRASECPFCAQGLASSPLLTHYRAYFGDAYNRLRNDIARAGEIFRVDHSGDVRSAFERSVKELVERHAFWKSYTELPEPNLDTAQISRVWKSARENVESLLDAKRRAPLDALDLSADAERTLVAHNAQCDRVVEFSEQFAAANVRLDVIKEQAKDANIAVLASDLANLTAIQSRYDPAISRLCDAYNEEKAAKVETEGRRDAARANLDQHRQAAFPAYGAAINEFLQRFNASFRVGPVGPVNTRGGSSANYTLLIDGHEVPLSGEPNAPSFRNTLSAGDRNTLALAFFFASLLVDPQRAQKIVVIDDPMTSLDEHRTLHTLQEVDRLVRDVAGMIVLSHSKPFLLGVWEKCRQLPKVALEVLRSGAGSTISSWDVDAAMVTEHDRRYKLVTAYLEQANPAVERRVAEALRPMLEAFCRVSYSTVFPPGAMLGRFHTQCIQRLGAPNEIMNAANAQELRDLLDFSNRYHHDTNAAYATELINDAELSDFARRTLSFIRRS